MSFVYSNRMMLDPEKVNFSKMEDVERDETVYRASIEAYAEIHVSNELLADAGDAWFNARAADRLTSEVLDSMVQVGPKLHATSCEPCPFCGFVPVTDSEVLDPDKHHDGCFLKMLREQVFLGSKCKSSDLLAAWNRRMFS